MGARSPWLVGCLVLAACGSEAPGPDRGDQGDLPLGDVIDSVEQGLGGDDWGSALTCKPIPNLPTLIAPEITVSINGLTLRLVDAQTGYDRVFPVGVGAVDEDPTSSTYLESLSYYPVRAKRSSEFLIATAQINPCRIWWNNSDTGQTVPSFAGLPFMSFHGNYAIHGPIDNYRAPNGGTLRRGFVSHGCIRMEALDIAEVYARIRGVSHVPVRLQRAPERDELRRRVDVPQKWIGAECSADTDCNYAQGYCQQNPYSGRGFCSAPCTLYCPDRAGYPMTICVSHPSNPSQGMCTSRSVPTNDCRTGDHLVTQSVVRHNQPSYAALACRSGSIGWIGDRCLSSTDCQAGNMCVGAVAGIAGTCTQACTRVCPDQPNAAFTFCATDPLLGATCLRQCTPSSNASECPANAECLMRQRPSEATSRYVCVPTSP